MIHVYAVTKQFEVISDAELNRQHASGWLWVWVDFDRPTEEEAKLLDSFFHFHTLAIEDCLHQLQRPKLDHYEDYHFLILHSIEEGTLNANEIDLFLGPQYVVTYHAKPQIEFDEFRQKMFTNHTLLEKGPVYACYLIIDKLVDHYFPLVHQIEDELLNLDNNEDGRSSNELMDKVFALRSSLLSLRKSIFPMRDLLYRLINTDKIEGIKDTLAYYRDIHDHLLKLSEMVESNREMTSDFRDNFLSVNSYRMNAIMKTLTVITTIFMPLTFIAGLYGMNFQNMPELRTRYGYFVVLFVMFSLGAGMFWWFRKKKWF